MIIPYQAMNFWDYILVDIRIRPLFNIGHELYTYSKPRFTAQIFMENLDLPSRAIVALRCICIPKFND